MLLKFEMLDDEDAVVAGTPTVTVDGVAATPSDLTYAWAVEAAEGSYVKATLTGARTVAQQMPYVDGTTLSTFDPATENVTVAGFATGVAAALAAGIEAALVNETDATALLQAIIDKFAATFPDVDELNVAGLTAAFRADVERAGGLLALTKASADEANRVAPDNASAQSAATDAAAAKTAAQAADTKAAAIQAQSDKLTFNESNEVAASASLVLSPEEIAAIASEVAAAVNDETAPAGYVRYTIPAGTLLPGTVIDAYLPSDTDYSTPQADNAVIGSNGGGFIDLPENGAFTLVGRFAGKNPTVMEGVTT